MNDLIDPASSALNPLEAPLPAPTAESEIEALKVRMAALEQACGEVVKLSLFVWKALGNSVTFTTEEEALAAQGGGKAPRSNN